MQGMMTCGQGSSCVEVKVWAGRESRNQGRVAKIGASVASARRGCVWYWSAACFRTIETVRTCGGAVSRSGEGGKPSSRAGELHLDHTRCRLESARSSLSTSRPADRPGIRYSASHLSSFFFSDALHAQDTSGDTLQASSDLILKCLPCSSILGRSSTGKCNRRSCVI